MNRSFSWLYVSREGFDYLKQDTSVIMLDRKATDPVNRSKPSYT